MCIDLQSDVSDLGTDVLAFAITISPDEQSASMSSIRLDILGDASLGLTDISTFRLMETSFPGRTFSTYVMSGASKS